MLWLTDFRCSSELLVLPIQLHVYKIYLLIVFLSVISTIRTGWIYNVFVTLRVIPRLQYLCNSTDFWIHPTCQIKTEVNGIQLKWIIFMNIMYLCYHLNKLKLYSKILLVGQYFLTTYVRNVKITKIVWADFTETIFLNGVAFTFVQLAKSDQLLSHLVIYLLSTFTLLSCHHLPRVT